MYHYTLNGIRKELNCLTYNKEYIMFDVDDNDIIWAIIILGSVMFVIMNPFR